MMPDEHGDIRPIPDPTKLTTEVLMREISRVEAGLGEAILKLKEFHELDRRRLEEVADATVKDMVNRIDCVEEIIGEKLTAVQLQFDLVERQRRESKQDNQTALDAALIAMKESLNGLGSTYTAAHSTLVSLVDDLRSRITALEALRTGGKEGSTTMYAVVGIILTVVWIAISLLAFVHR